VLEVFRESGTFYENYAPEYPAAGNPAKSDFVGWSGLGPIAMLFEHVFGIHPDAANSRLTWNIRLLEAHGVRQYPFGKSGMLDIKCAARSNPREKPEVNVISNTPLVLDVFWEGGHSVAKISAKQK